MSALRFLTMLALASSVVIACDDDDDSTGPNTDATLRFVNASTTTTSFDVLQNGTAVTGATNIAYGNTTPACVPVNATTPALTFRQNGTTNAISGPSTMNLQAGHKYTLVFEGNTGNPVWTMFEDTPVALTASQGGVRVINASGTNNLDVYVTANGAALGTAKMTGLGAGTQSAFFPTTSGASQVRLTTGGTQTVVLNTGSFNLGAGSNQTVVVADPAPGSSALRFFILPSTCS